MAKKRTAAARLREARDFQRRREAMLRTLEAESAAAVEAALDRTGLSLRQLARRLGLSPAYLCKLRSGAQRASLEAYTALLEAAS